MLGRRLAGTTGTPAVTTSPQPQGTWAPWTATIGTTTCGSARTWGGLLPPPQAYIQRNRSEQSLHSALGSRRGRLTSDASPDRSRSCSFGACGNLRSGPIRFEAEVPGDLLSRS
jgi:hypothetical protein